MEEVDGISLRKEMKEQIQKMLNLKVKAIKVRILFISFLPPLLNYQMKLGIPKNFRIIQEKYQDFLELHTLGAFGKGKIYKSKLYI